MSININKLKEYDQENVESISEELSNKFYSLLEGHVKDYDLVIISDYNKGFLTVENSSKFISIANKNNVKVLIDIKEPNYDKYKNAFIIKPNFTYFFI